MQPPHDEHPDTGVLVRLPQPEKVLAIVVLSGHAAPVQLRRDRSRSVRRSVALALAAVTLVSGGCGGDGRGDDAAPTTSGPSATETVAAVECGSGATGAGDGDASAAFLELYCARMGPVGDVMTELGIRIPTAEQIETARSGLCAPGATVPARDALELSIAKYIRAKAQADPELGKRWLARGLIDAYERKDQGNGTFYLNFEFNDATLALLTDSQGAVYDAVTADRSTYCG